MDDLIDSKAEMKDKRGKTLPVLCILSWIYIGYFVVTALIAFVSGPQSEEELISNRVQTMEALQEGTPQFWIDFTMDALDYAEMATEKFYANNGLRLATALIGFLAVFFMYRLKKMGYWLYILYSAFPIIVQYMLFPDNMLTNGFAIWYGIFGGLFMLLYGLQLKRME